MSTAFVAEIRMFPLNFAPTGWAFCDGQILPISQNTALFSLLGTQYGGNGQSTFALPDLQGRSAVHKGTLAGGSTYEIGETTGEETVALITSEMPAHSHNVLAKVAGGNADPNNNVWGTSGAQKLAANFYAPPPADITMNVKALNLAGADQGHNNLMPYITINFCIALQGVFPPRP